MTLFKTLLFVTTWLRNYKIQAAFEYSISKIIMSYHDLGQGGHLLQSRRYSMSMGYYIFYWCWFWNSNHPVSLKLCGTKKLPYCVSPRRHFLASNSFQPNTPTHPSSNLGWKDRETYCERVENSTIDEGHAPGTSVICTLWLCFIGKHLVLNSFYRKRDNFLRHR